jgi:hypothetical protein
VPKERRGGEAEAVDDHEVGRVALGDRDRGGVGDRDRTEEQRRARSAEATSEDDQQRDHQHDGSIEQHRRCGQGADSAHQYVEGEGSAMGGGGERAGRAFGETGTLDQRGQRERRGEERHQRHDHRQSRHGWRL